MLGGYQIINLTKLDLTVGASQVSITDKDVLDQLRNIRDYIEDDYNYAKPLNHKLKPVLLRLRDKKNGEKQEVSIWANMSIITNNKTFKIEALVDSVSMKAIQIEVVFQQLTDDDGNKYWDIKTAKYLLTENINIEGGTIEADTLLENIKDKDGHNRFIEGVINIQNHYKESGVTQNYGKWSLSGTHLMVVLAGAIADTSVIGSGLFASFTVPEWVYNKIFPVASTYLDSKDIALRDENWGTQAITVAFVKGDNALRVYLTSSVTLTSTKGFRIAFDLLIDNEQD